MASWLTMQFGNGSEPTSRERYSFPPLSIPMKISLQGFIFLFLSAIPAGSALAQGYFPQEAVRHIHVPNGFRVSLVASEPEVRKPVTMTFDGRGRMWVIQYLQYPNPSRLKPIKVDQYLRTTYDRLPE